MNHRSHDEHRSWGESPLDAIPILKATYWNQQFDRHFHDFFVIGVNEGGTARSWFRGSDRLPQPGSLIVIPPGEIHDGRRAGKRAWTYRAIYPHAATLLAIAEELSGREVDALDFDAFAYEDQDLAAEFVAAHEDLESGEDSLRAESRMLECLGRIISRYADTRLGPGPEPGEEPRAIRKVLDDVEAHLGEKITLRRMAEVAGFSRFHFIRVFSRSQGLTPHAYVLQRRVQRARELLAEGRDIASVAFETGFADQSHLTRRFKAIVGVTPGELVRGSS